jgi:hypothetical protein
MAKPNKKGRRITERFIALPHYMTGCPAFLTLSPDAKALLIDVWRRHNGTNNGEISYSVREAEGIGLSKSRTARAFGDLMERGFLKVRRASSFTVKTKAARTWEITSERCGDTPPTKDFMRWNAPKKNRTQSHQRDTQSHQRDRERLDETILPVSVPPAGPSGHDQTVPQSHQRDTYRYTIPPSEKGQASTAPTDPKQASKQQQQGQPGYMTPSPGTPGPARHQKRPPAPPDPRQVDIEDLLGRPSAAAPAASRVDALRSSIKAHIAAAPKGEQARLARSVGLSPCSMSNLLAGRAGLSPARMAALDAAINPERSAA